MTVRGRGTGTGVLVERCPAGSGPMLGAVGQGRSAPFCAGLSLPAGTPVGLLHTHYSLLLLASHRPVWVHFRHGGIKYQISTLLFIYFILYFVAVSTCFVCVFLIFIVVISPPIFFWRGAGEATKIFDGLVKKKLYC